MQIKQISESDVMVDQTQSKDSDISQTEDRKIENQPNEEDKSVLELPVNNDKLEFKAKDEQIFGDDKLNDKVLHKKDPYKEYSVLKLHTKRLNVLKYLSALSLEVHAREHQRNTNQTNFMGVNAMGSTAAGFFKEDHEAKYNLVHDKNSVGDKNLLISEMKRSNQSKLNIAYILLTAFLILCTGLCAAAMFIFDDDFARNVFIMVIIGYILDFFIFRLFFILTFG